MKYARTLRSILALVAVAVVAASSSDAVAKDADSSLVEAYKEEVTYLEAQKSALEARLEELDRREEVQVGAAQKEVDTLSGRLLSLQSEADRLEETLAEVERDAARMAEGEDAVATTLEQANATFEKWGDALELTGEQKADQVGVVDALFGRAKSLVDAHHSIRTEEGAFFLPDGARADGKIVLVGNVAAFGVSDQASGALAPAGDGRLKLWKEDASQTAKALASGTSPEVTRAFLFESRDKAVEEKAEKTWLDVVNSGGTIAWVIVGLGVLGLLFVLLRALVLWRSGANTRELVGEVSRLVVAGELEAARRQCEATSGAASRVLAQTLAHIDAGREELEDIVSESILHELPTIERFGSAILVFAAVAPLLGLLGTVTGMISTFDIITEFGTGDPKLLSGGISEALVTTQLGLIVAIPLLLVGNLLKGWASGITTDLERGALRLMNLARLARQAEQAREDGQERPRLETVELAEEAEYLGVI